MREPSEEDREKVGRTVVKWSQGLMIVFAVVLQIMAITGFVTEGFAFAPIVRQCGVILIMIAFIVSYVNDRKNQKDKNEGEKDS